MKRANENLSIQEVYKKMYETISQLKREGKLLSETVRSVEKANRVSSLYMQEFDEKRRYSGSKNLDVVYRG